MPEQFGVRGEHEAISGRAPKIREWRESQHTEHSKSLNANGNSQFNSQSRAEIWSFGVLHRATSGNCWSFGCFVAAFPATESERERGGRIVRKVVNPRFSLFPWVLLKFNTYKFYNPLEVSQLVQNRYMQSHSGANGCPQIRFVPFRHRTCGGLWGFTLWVRLKI